MKKGFTLVELLAVVAIMALVILIAIPNVIEGINGARKDNFVNEVNTIISSAKSQYNLDKGRSKVKYEVIGGKRIAPYCQDWTAEGETDCNDENTLSNSNTSKFKYRIELNVDGVIQNAFITDNRFYYRCCSEEECKGLYDDGEGNLEEKKVAELVIDATNRDEVPYTCTYKNPY